MEHASESMSRNHILFGFKILKAACKVYNSSTAQSGGGSFKNTKPIREVSCCESWMAERIHWWTERWLECRAAEFFQKKRPSTKTFRYPPEAPGPRLNVANHRFSMTWARMVVFFFKLCQALLSHNIEVGGPGLSNSPSQTSSWLAVFFEEPRLLPGSVFLDLWMSTC